MPVPPICRSFSLPGLGSGRSFGWRPDSSCPLTRHQYWQRNFVDEVARNAAEQDVTHPRMGEGANSQQIRACIMREGLQRRRDPLSG